MRRVMDVFVLRPVSLLLSVCLLSWAGAATSQARLYHIVDLSGLTRFGTLLIETSFAGREWPLVEFSFQAGGESWSIDNIQQASWVQTPNSGELSQLQIVPHNGRAQLVLEGREGHFLAGCVSRTPRPPCTAVDASSGELNVFPVKLVAQYEPAPTRLLLVGMLLACAALARRRLVRRRRTRFA